MLGYWRSQYHTFQYIYRDILENIAYASPPTAVEGAPPEAIVLGRFEGYFPSKSVWSSKLFFLFRPGFMSCPYSRDTLPITPYETRQKMHALIRACNNTIKAIIQYWAINYSNLEPANTPHYLFALSILQDQVIIILMTVCFFYHSCSQV